MPTSLARSPHFEFTREYGVESLHKIFALAQKYDRLIDVHCDEIDDEQSRFVETVAALAHRDNMGERVTASHTTAMHSYNGAYASRLFRLLKMSGINFVANPLVNIHLQGRFDTYPKRRGVTRVKEMLEADINVCFGHDDVFDPWYPLGTANMLQVLHMGLHVCQLMGYGQINDGLNLITTHSAKTPAPAGLRSERGEFREPGDFTGREWVWTRFVARRLHVIPFVTGESLPRLCRAKRHCI
ncbi:cytosine deaminase [Citrobacter freundii]|nr:cytosine deaminase [Citrobacter freundii]